MLLHGSIIMENVTSVISQDINSLHTRLQKFSVFFSGIYFFFSRDCYCTGTGLLLDCLFFLLQKSRRSTENAQRFKWGHSIAILYHSRYCYWIAISFSLPISSLLLPFSIILCIATSILCAISIILCIATSILCAISIILCTATGQPLPFSSQSRHSLCSSLCCIVYI